MGEERDLPMPNQKLMLKPSHGTDMVDITVMAIHTDTVGMDTGEERDLPMPSQQLKLMLMLKLSHGIMLVTMDTHTLMVVTTDTLIAITTLERDLLMLNQAKPWYGYRGYYGYGYPYRY